MYPSMLLLSSLTLGDLPGGSSSSVPLASSGISAPCTCGRMLGVSLLTKKEKMPVICCEKLLKERKTCTASAILVQLPLFWQNK